jgi:hypothetical protein
MLPQTLYVLLKLLLAVRRYGEVRLPQNKGSVVRYLTGLCPPCIFLDALAAFQNIQSKLLTTAIAPHILRALASIMPSIPSMTALASPPPPQSYDSFFNYSSSKNPISLPVC